MRRVLVEHAPDAGAKKGIRIAGEQRAYQQRRTDKQDVQRHKKTDQESTDHGFFCIAWNSSAA